MPTLETMRKTGPAKIEDAIKALKYAVKAVDKIDEAIDAVDHSNGANWRKTAAWTFLASGELIAISRESAKGPAYYRRAGFLLIATES